MRMSFLQNIFTQNRELSPEDFAARKNMSIERDPDVEGGFRIRFGPEPNDYFPAQGNRKDILALRSIVSKVVEDEYQLAKIRNQPIEKRPTLIRDASQKCGGYCNGEYISITPSTGTGYNAASTFVHEFQHQYQFDRDADMRLRSFSMTDTALNERIMEAAADTESYRYLYRMKDKNIQAQMVFLNEMLEEPGMRAYSSAKRKGKNEEECIVAGMKGYAEGGERAKWYAEHYHDLKYTTTVIDTMKRKVYGTSSLENEAVKQNEKLLSQIFEGQEAMDLDEAIRLHTVSMIRTDAGVSKAKTMVRSKEFNYVSRNMARFLQFAAKVREKQGKKTDLSHLNVRNVYGVFSLGNRAGNTVAKLMYETKSRASSVKNLFKKPSKPLYNAFGYYDKGKQFITLNGDRTKKPGDDYGIIKFNPTFVKNKELSSKEETALKRKTEDMFRILMKDPIMKENLMSYGKDAELGLSFSRDFNPPFTTNANEIVLNPDASAFELAAEFAGQMQKVRQNEAARESAGGDLKAYNAEKSMLRQPAQSMLEDRICDAAVQAAKARFMHLNKHRMSLKDRISAGMNPAFKAYESALKKHGNHTTATVAVIEETAKRDRTDRSSEFSTRYKWAKSRFEKGDHLPAVLAEKGKEAALQEMYTQTVSNDQIARIACAGLLPKAAEEYVAKNTMTKPQVNFVSEKNHDGILEMQALKRDDGYDYKASMAGCAYKDNGGALYLNGEKVLAEKPLEKIELHQKRAEHTAEPGTKPVEAVVDRPAETVVKGAESMGKGAEPVENRTPAPLREPTGAEMVSMADKIAFRASKINQSDTYYRPETPEAEAAAKLVKLSRDAVKSAGVDYRSAAAKDVRAAALAEYARTPEGKKDMAVLEQASERMKRFERKPEAGLHATLTKVASNTNANKHEPPTHQSGATGNAQVFMTPLAQQLSSRLGQQRR